MSDAALLSLAFDRMPHSGPMRLIETITRLDEAEIHCIPRDHRQPDFPLRLNGNLHPSVLVELGAQAAAAHSSIHGIGGKHIGLLLSIQSVTLNHAASLGEPLQVYAARVDAFGQSAQYRFEVTTQGVSVVGGKLLLQMKETS